MLNLAGFDARLFGYAGYNMKSDLANDGYINDITGFNLEVDYAYNAFDFSLGFGLVNFEGVGLTNTSSTLPVALTAATAGENEAMSMPLCLRV